MPTNSALAFSFGLGAALCWALGSLLFHRIPAPAGALNLFKNAIGGLLLAVVLLTRGQGPFEGLLAIEALLPLALSALVGLAVGDTCYFRSLQILGPRRASLLAILAPPFATLLGFAILAERYSPTVLIGIVVTLAGVAWVIAERTSTRESAGLFPGTLAQGVAFGLIGSLCQATGIILTKQGLEALSDHGLAADGIALHASFIRLLFAACIGAAVAGATGRLGGWLRTGRLPEVWTRLLPAAFCGTFLGIWFSVLAYQYAHSGLAATLTSTTPLFVLVIVVVTRTAPVSTRGAIGAAVAVAGIVLLALAKAQ